MKKEYLIIVLILVYFLFVVEPEVIYQENVCFNSEVFVEVKGEVNSQGVFQVNETFRVIEVIELAGGFTENADILSINLSQKVTDELVIIVEAIESKDHNFVNINEATLSELMMLPNLGVKKAEAIIDYRENTNKFNEIADIKNVTGIGDSIFNAIKDLISTK